MNVRNTPFPASWLKKAAPPLAGPPPPPSPPCDAGAASFSPIPISRGNSTTTASSSWFRRRKKTSRSSLRKNLRFPRTYATGSLSPATPPATSAWLMVDIEALPGEAYEELFQARRLDGKAAHPDAGVHELGADELGFRGAELGGDRVLPLRGVGEAQLAEHLGRRRHVCRAHRDAGRPRAAQLGQRALEHQLADPHHADVRAHLLDLGQQV